ncbi:RagB/SusD family nutrient uptake outer membrane protein [Sphingobacterium faecale]|uniref:RagB/SusD family nutrient uptake outer membrane protein n=1 Tax=Sphingobacterium faecale TaxID=2803775 RepID=A0ABS1RA95_9SPHI|nr:RagB/SusD family nutrient uptake outer membrane protein [Sphingobacterium faecale]MBL1411464.1 RagB/SusD family nutrient uptake outer membrane protein [Sphingobacterium faecale]
MNKIFILIQAFALSMLILISSCDSYLDKEPEEILDQEHVFNNEAYTFRFLSSVYSSIPLMAALNDDFTQNPYVGGSDEMEITYSGAFSNNLNSGAWGPSDIRKFWDKTVIWGHTNEGLRKASIFLENIDNVPMDSKRRDRWKGEGIFLRAYFLFILARAHGPIPLYDTPFRPDHDFTTLMRAPIDEVFEFIASECDRAAALLEPNVVAGEKGRATSIAALALKSRSLLYLASPLWNGNPMYADLKNNDGKRLVPDYDKERWKAAYEAAKKCVDQAEINGYGLYYAPDNDPMKSYEGIFLNNHNKEVLFARNIGPEVVFEGGVTPLGHGGYSTFCPTQAQVDAYQMADGSSPIKGYITAIVPDINVSSGYKETGFAAAHPKGYHPSGISNMYANREPRFYASINFSGSIWKGRPVELWYSGRDGRSKGNLDYCVTGYIQRKMADPDADISKWKARDKAYIHFRLAEIYLNYAEALNEYSGPNNEVIDYINKVRKRAGFTSGKGLLPYGTMNTEAVREAIIHERRIEFAFEAFRYFDVRRLLIAEKTESRPVTGMSINEGGALNDPAYYKRAEVEKRVFESPKHYLWPIPQEDINKSPNLVQNPRW